MKAFETPFDARLPPGLPIVLRVDGHGFHRFAARGAFERPFDARLQDALIAGARAFVEATPSAALAYLQSDEINVLLRPERAPLYDNRVQKLVSIAASRVTAGCLRALLAAGHPAEGLSFDARAFVLPPDRVVDYFVWRQEDAFKNCVNAVTFWGLIDAEGLSPEAAHARLAGQSLGAQQELAFQALGVNVNDVPPRWRRGVALRPAAGGWATDWAMPRLTQDRGYVEAALRSGSRP